MTPLPKITLELEKYKTREPKTYYTCFNTPKKIKTLRITIKPRNNNIDIYIEYKHRNKWYLLPQSKIYTIIRQAINGISFGDTKANKIKKEIKKWLKGWMKENNIHWGKPGDNDEKVEEQTWKTNVPSVKEVTTNTLVSEVKLRTAKINVALTKSLQ